MVPDPGPISGQRLSDYDFDLPPGLIAQSPSKRRDGSRLMVIDRASGELQHLRFPDILGLLSPGDVLVANDARVFPARLVGTKVATGGKVELLLCEALDGPEAEHPRWKALGQASKGLKVGQSLEFDGLRAEVLDAEGEGSYVVRFDERDIHAALARVGQIPLPPYIHREGGSSDGERYQTVYAREPVAAAAPTAGLHFTRTILRQLKRRGVQWATLTLHVGPGTFLPVRVDDLRDHRMHSERFEIPRATALAIQAAKGEGRRVIAVGTTSLRALEGNFAEHGAVVEGTSRTSIFITPGFRFRVVDALVTNFHLPRSTLLMLVSAFAGQEPVLQAYAEAVRQSYRFFSYGDATFFV